MTSKIERLKEMNEYIKNEGAEYTMDGGYLYSKIALPILFNPAISSTKKILYTIIMTYQNVYRVAFPSQSTLGKMVGLTRNRVSTLLSEMEQEGLIKKFGEFGYSYTYIVKNPVAIYPFMSDEDATSYSYFFNPKEGFFEDLTKNSIGNCCDENDCKEDIVIESDFDNKDMGGCKEPYSGVYENTRGVSRSLHNRKNNTLQELNIDKNKVKSNDFNNSVFLQKKEEEGTAQISNTKKKELCRNRNIKECVNNKNNLGDVSNMVNSIKHKNKLSEKAKKKRDEIINKKVGAQKLAEMNNEKMQKEKEPDNKNRTSYFKILQLIADKQKKFFPSITQPNFSQIDIVKISHVVKRYNEQKVIDMIEYCFDNWEIVKGKVFFLKDIICPNVSLFTTFKIIDTLIEIMDECDYQKNEFDYTKLGKDDSTWKIKEKDYFSMVGKYWDKGK